MTIHGQIRDEKLQYDINREAAKISASSSGEIRKYEYLTGDDILPSNQQQIIEQAKFTYSPLGKAFEKQIKTIKEQGEKQVKALNTLKSNNNNNNNNKLTIEYVIPKSDFRNFQTIRIFGKDIHEVQITFEEGDEDQSDLLNKIKNFNDKIRPKNNIKKQEKEIVLKNLYDFFDGREKALNDFKSKIFLTKSKETGRLNANQFELKILRPKQMLQRLPKALAEVKAGNNSENLLDKIRQIIYSLYQSKEITKKLYNNIIKSI